MENGRQRMGKIKSLQKTIKVIPSTIPNENCHFPPIYNNSTKRKQKKLFYAHVIHHKMLLTVGYDPH